MITVENLSKSFSSKDSAVHALRNVSIDIAAGSLYGVLGPAKAGKSTLARCLALLERPDRGVVRWDGLNTATLDVRGLREVRRQVGVVDVRAGLSPQRSVAGNIAVPLEQLGVDGPQRRRKVGDLLDLVGLTQRGAGKTEELTPGQHRRVAVAKALAVSPSVLFVDDPTAGVSADESGAVLSVLDRARSELGVTILVTTSDATVVRRLCDEVAILEDGTLLEQGSVLKLLADPLSRTAQSLLPTMGPDSAQLGGYDRSADVVLIGFAAVGALLPEAAQRFGVDVATVGGGLTRIGDTPVARFRLGVRGQHADAALAWIGERGAHVTHSVLGPQGIAA